MTGKKKLNFIDILIIVSIFLIITAIIYRIVITNNTGSSLKKQSVEYTLTTDTIDIKYKDFLKAGDKLYLKDSNVFCGTIHEITTVFVKEQIANEYGLNEEHINPSKIRFELKIKLTARANESKIFTENNMHLIPGQQLDLYTKNISFSGKLNSFSTSTNK